jgi:hypothetical protein
MQGGISAITLPAGYLGSSLIGALLIMCGFNIVASKVASIVLGVCFLLTLWWARKDWLTIGTIIAAVGLLIACWFIKHAEPLRFVVVSHNKSPGRVKFANKTSSSSLVSCPPSTVSGIFATISSSEKSTNLMPVFSLNDMVDRHNAGVLSGRLYRCSSWLVVFLLESLLSPKTGKNKRMIRRSSSLLEGLSQKRRIEIRANG